MLKDAKYLIFRKYTKEEREDRRDRDIFYGWTDSKIVKNGFLSQRTKSKYYAVKMYDEDIAQYYSEDVLDDSSFIIMLRMPSAKHPGQEVNIFTTRNEEKQAEINIQEMLRDATRLDKLGGDLNKLVQIFIHIDDWYADALDFIGYRPPELESMFPSITGDDDLTSTERDIENAYDGSYDVPSESYSGISRNLPGLATLQDDAKKILYSIESLVKALRDDL